MLPFLISTALSEDGGRSSWAKGTVTLFIALLLLFWGFRGIRRGVLPTKSGTFEREKHYFRFWLFTTMFLVMGFLVLVAFLAHLFEP